MAVKKHKLDLAMEEDFCLLGIVVDEPDYNLCWMINRALELNLEKQDDLNLYHRKGDTDQLFSLFSFEDEECLLTYRVIGNRTENGYFLEEIRNIDYLVHIQGEIYEDKIQLFLQTVGALPGVRMCVPVDLIRLRDKERLMLW